MLPRGGIGRIGIIVDCDVRGVLNRVVHHSGIFVHGRREGHGSDCTHCGFKLPLDGTGCLVVLSAVGSIVVIGDALRQRISNDDRSIFTGLICPFDTVLDHIADLQPIVCSRILRRLFGHVDRDLVSLLGFVLANFDGRSIANRVVPHGIVGHTNLEGHVTLRSSILLAELPCDRPGFLIVHAARLFGTTLHILRSIRNTIQYRYFGRNSNALCIDGVVHPVDGVCKYVTHTHQLSVDVGHDTSDVGFNLLRILGYVVGVGKRRNRRVLSNAVAHTLVIGCLSHGLVDVESAVTIVGNPDRDGIACLGIGDTVDVASRFLDGVGIRLAAVGRRIENIAKMIRMDTVRHIVGTHGDRLHVTVGACRHRGTVRTGQRKGERVVLGPHVVLATGERLFNNQLRRTA